MQCKYGARHDAWVTAQQGHQLYPEEKEDDTPRAVSAHQKQKGFGIDYSGA
jgi:hypothetical protein